MPAVCNIVKDCLKKSVKASFGNRIVYHPCRSRIGSLYSAEKQAHCPLRLAIQIGTQTDQPDIAVIVAAAALETSAEADGDTALNQSPDGKGLYIMLDVPEGETAVAGTGTGGRLVGREGYQGLEIGDWRCDFRRLSGG